MPVDVRSERLTQLVDENVEVEQLGTGFTFTEGPVWHPRDEYLLFSDIPAVPGIGGRRRARHRGHARATSATG